MKPEKNALPRPLHEVLVEQIGYASNAELEALGVTISQSLIMSGHEDLIKAWRARTTAMCWGKEREYVVKSLRRQQELLNELPPQFRAHAIAAYDAVLTQIRGRNE